MDLTQRDAVAQNAQRDVHYGVLHGAFARFRRSQSTNSGTRSMGRGQKYCTLVHCAERKHGEGEKQEEQEEHGNWEKEAKEKR